MKHTKDFTDKEKKLNSEIKIVMAAHVTQKPRGLADCSLPRVTGPQTEASSKRTNPFDFRWMILSSKVRAYPVHRVTFQNKRSYE